MQKVVLSTLTLLLIMFFSSAQAQAALLPRFQKATKAAGSRSPGVSVGVRLRADRRALNISFNGLQNTSSIFYSLSYQTNGKEEGAGGTIDTAGRSSLSRELLFGTCSSGVCRYHSNITNAKFEVTTTYSSGKKTLKRYRIKV